ncbi:MAG: hypothetical protein EOL97_13425 [Spirochaetia bacterium]|nr:hypothetical protein [Tissierellia bacterium]NCD07113.1 hypothetical protein [Spirochaetia bacterium]
MRYPKMIMQIQDKLFEISNNIVIEEDMGQLYSTLSFDLPALETENWSTLDLAKYDVVKIYYKMFDTKQEYNISTIDDLILIFSGYIDSLPLSEDKTSGLLYSSISCKSTIALSYERTTLTKFYNTNIYTLLEKAFLETEIDQYLPAENIYINGISENFILNIESTSKLGEVLDEIKEKYAIQIYQSKDYLFINTPFYFTQRTITPYELDLESNIFSINYGDITQSINCIVVIGSGSIGIAFDPISYQLQNGIKQEDLQNSVVPNPLKLYPQYIYRRDIMDSESCQQIARDKLLEIAKNYSITLDTPYIPEMNVGDQFIIKNSKKISEKQIWTIKRRTITINKTDIKQTIIGYSNSISDFPEDMLLASDGILDTDILNLGDKIASTF